MQSQRAGVLLLYQRSKGKPDYHTTKKDRPDDGLHPVFLLFFAIGVTRV